MKTSVRKFNQQYRTKRLEVNGVWNAEVVPTCNEHKRCDVCPVHSHVKFCAITGNSDGELEIYVCPTCGKSYAVLYEWPDEEKEEEPTSQFNKSKWLFVKADTFEPHFLSALIAKWLIELKNLKQRKL